MTESIRNNRLNLLARRGGYNLALRHFRLAQEFAGDVEDGYNLADTLNEALDAERIAEFQIRPVLNILLAERFIYSFGSENLKEDIESAEALFKAVSTWTNIQIVVVYTDANGGIHLLNPEMPDDWEAVFPLAADECLVCYAGALTDVSEDITDSAVSDFFTLLYGGRVRAKAAYKTSEDLKLFYEEEEPESPQTDADDQRQEKPVQQAAPSASRKLTAKISVNVTNELFHNGNVEAWKRVIESYKLKYPTADVLIWYEGERINDINALFKWGKVKHGVPIMFSVAGENPSEVSKLRKYLFEGASPRFEAFLHGAPGTILKLF